MYCIEESTCGIVETFWRPPPSDSAPGTLRPLGPLVTSLMIRDFAYNDALSIPAEFLACYVHSSSAMTTVAGCNDAFSVVAESISSTRIRRRIHIFYAHSTSAILSLGLQRRFVSVPIFVVYNRVSKLCCPRATEGAAQQFERRTSYLVIALAPGWQRQLQVLFAVWSVRPGMWSRHANHLTE